MNKNSDDTNNQQQPTDNVVSINELTARKPMSTGSKHLHETHRVFVQSIHPRLNDFFAGLNDFFFDMAEQAESNAQQNAYFSAIGETRKNKSELTRQFAQNVNVIFQKFKSKDFIYFIESNQQTENTKQKLTLIKEDDLDQKLAINNVIVKVSQQYHKDLYLLNLRFAELAEQEVDNHTNPIGPDAIVNAFALSLKILKSENNIKLMIIKLFEKNMIETLGPAYRMVNKYFKKHHVLPDIQFQVKQAKQSGHTINNSINYLAQKLSGEDENFKKIADILDHDREQDTQHNYSAASIVQFSQLTDALNQIKAELLTDQEMLNNQSISPLELKDQLLKKLKSLKAISAHQSLNKADENTIDLIGELFQFLVEDRQLPETIQLVLSKLQLPYLQIALKDQSFFSDKQNNARQLLNIMAESAIGWSPQTDDKGMFLNKIKEIVNFILQNHEKNINYAKLIDRFVIFDQQIKKRALINERRNSAKISGRERLNQAKNQTALFLKAQLAGQKIPALVREILLQPWANVLILSELRQQESPELLQKNQQFVRKLVAAANPDSASKTPEDAIQALCQELTEGLKLVAYDIKDLSTKSKQIKACLKKINGFKTSTKAVQFIDPKDILKLSKEFNQESSVGALIKNPDMSLTSPENIPVIDDEHNDKAMNIELGEWIQIDADHADGQPQRVKLSWKSPISGKLLFVNAKGAKVMDLFPIELAAQLRCHKIQLLQQIPLLDRAMSSIADKMKIKRVTPSK